MKFCPYCGIRLEEGHGDFCASCGNKLTESMLPKTSDTQSSQNQQKFEWEQMPNNGAQQNAGAQQYNYTNYGAAPTDMPASYNGFAIASLVLGICSFFFNSFLFIPSILGIVFGVLARKAMKENPGKYKGEGMALAGLICAIIGLALYILCFIFAASLFSSVVNSYYNFPYTQIFD